DGLPLAAIPAGEPDRCAVRHHCLKHGSWRGSNVCSSGHCRRTAVRCPCAVRRRLRRRRDRGLLGAAPQATQAAQSDEPAAEEEGTEGEEGESEEEREEREAEEAGGKECTEVGDLDGEPKDAPPSDVTVLEDAHVYESEGPFGKTERFFAAVDGE